MTTSQDLTQQAQIPLTGQVFGPADYANFGNSLGQAGFTTTEVSEIMGTIEREAMAAATAAARQVALSVANRITQMIQRTHYNASMEIYRRIVDRGAGLGGVTWHRRCAEQALNVANSIPRHDPPPAAPILGSPR